VGYRWRVSLASDLTSGSTQHDVEEQGMRSAWFTRAEVEGMVRDGALSDGKSLAAYTLLLLQDPMRPA
jgi:hypothetical protein